MSENMKNKDETLETLGGEDSASDVGGVGDENAVVEDASQNAGGVSEGLNAEDAGREDKKRGGSKATSHRGEKRGKKLFRSSIGGQAVLEGVMMRGERSMATSVREPNGNIAIESVRLRSVKEKNVVFRIPFIRGIFNFVGSMVSGVKTLMRSAEVYVGEEEASKTEKWLAKKLKIDVMDIVMGIAVALGIALSIGLFFFLPLGITEAFKLLDKNNVVPLIVWNLIDGVVRMMIFVAYIGLTSLMKDIKRTFMYHGAEHKTISCYEHGLDLTVENAKKMSTIHDRCGTTFMFLVMIVSILIFSLTGWEGEKTVGGFFLRFVIRLALLPVVAGVSYEILKFLAKFDNAFVRVIKAPGLLLQKITTKEPTDDMLECAISSFKTVMAMDADESIPEVKFDVKILYAKSREELRREIGEYDGIDSDLDWIYVSVLGVQRSELESMTHIRQSQFDKVKEMMKKRKSGMPLQHIIGDTSFYGYTIKTDGRALVPRCETEYLVEAVKKEIVAKKYTKGIDMCTGSGAIAIALSKECKGLESILAVDLSPYALSLARENIELNGINNITLLESDLFEKASGKFDFIVSNPPYIRSNDIDSLSVEVKSFEPRMALDGGESGLDFYERIVKESPGYLTLGGLLAFECGIGESDSVKEMMAERFENIRVINDLEGVERIVTGTLKNIKE